MRYTTLLTLCGSFILSSIAYMSANDNNDPPVQVIWMDEMEIRPNIDVIEFDDFIITSQKSEEKEESDGDSEGIDWDLNREFWCQTHPDECTIDVKDIDYDDERTC